MKITLFGISATLYMAVAALTAAAQEPPSPQPRRTPPWVSNLTLTTTAFPDGGEIPVKYAASKTPNSPRLEWSNPPEGTVSFALIFHDPDAAINRTHDDYLHWLVFNIPASVRELPEGMPPIPESPDGTIQVRTRGTTVGYIGPGAPPGPFHHYTFDLYALDIKLDLGPDATRDEVMKAMSGHILGKAVLIGRYRRSPPPAEQK